VGNACSPDCVGDVAGEGNAIGAERGGVAEHPANSVAASATKNADDDARMSRPAIMVTYQIEKPCLTIGSERMRLPVAANIALHTAGATNATAGSPMPPGLSSLSIN
jgi:hypothetical protein